MSNNELEVVKTIVADAHNDSAVQDFELARANIVIMVDTCKDAIDKLAQIAESSQHPRAFEVLAKLVDSGVAASKSLLDLQSKIRDLKQIDEPMNENARSVTNNLFVGSTKELQQIIKDMRNNGSN